MKILNLILDNLYAAFYHIGKTLFGRLGAWNYAFDAYHFIISYLIVIPLGMFIIFLLKPPMVIGLPLVTLIYIVIIWGYDKREKKLIQEGEIGDERYIGFLKKNFWLKLPFFFIAYAYTALLALSLGLIIYVIMKR